MTLHPTYINKLYYSLFSLLFAPFFLLKVSNSLNQFMPNFTFTPVWKRVGQLSFNSSPNTLTVNSTLTKSNPCLITLHKIERIPRQKSTLAYADILAHYLKQNIHSQVHNPFCLEASPLVAFRAKTYKHVIPLYLTRLNLPLPPHHHPTAQLLKQGNKVKLKTDLTIQALGRYCQFSWQTAWKEPRGWENPCNVLKFFGTHWAIMNFIS